MGALRAGLIVVNTNPLYTAREMEYQFKDAGISAIVIVANFAFNLEKVINEYSHQTYYHYRIGGYARTLKGALVNFVVKKVKKMVPAYHHSAGVSLKMR